MSTSVFTSFLCLMHLCSATPAMHATDDVIQQLDGRSSAVAREMMMSLVENGGRWLLAHPWYTGELPMSDVATYVQQAGDRWTPPAGMRMAIGSAAVKSPIYVWMEPGSNFTSLGTSAASLYVGLDKLYGHGLGTMQFRIGRAETINGQEVLLEPARGVTDPLPDVLTVPVGVGAVMLGGISMSCGTEPAAGDPALSLPGTDAPATRCHRDAWKETEACNFDHYDYVPNGSGGWTPLKIYKKTELIQGWNLSQPFTPTYAQLTDTIAYPAGTTMPPVPPSWAPQTNPSTFMTSNCATNAGLPAGAVEVPPPTYSTQTSQGSCPAGYTGAITYFRTDTHNWQVGANPSDVYSAWQQLSDNCVVAPGTTINTATGQQCNPGYWVPMTEKDPGGDNFTITFGYYWSGTGEPGNGWMVVPNTCPPTSPPPAYCDTQDSGGPCVYYGAGSYATLAGAGTALDGGGFGGSSGGGSYVADRNPDGSLSVHQGTTQSDPNAVGAADTALGAAQNATANSMGSSSGDSGFGGNDGSDNSAGATGL